MQMKSRPNERIKGRSKSGFNAELSYKLNANPQISTYDDFERLGLDYSSSSILPSRVIHSPPQPPQDTSGITDDTSRLQCTPTLSTKTLRMFADHNISSNMLSVFHVNPFTQQSTEHASNNSSRSRKHQFQLSFERGTVSNVKESNSRSKSDRGIVDPKTETGQPDGHAKEDGDHHTKDLPDPSVLSDLLSFDDSPPDDFVSQILNYPECPSQSLDFAAPPFPIGEPLQPSPSGYPSSTSDDSPFLPTIHSSDDLCSPSQNGYAPKQNMFNHDLLGATPSPIALQNNICAPLLSTIPLPFSTAEDATWAGNHDPTFPFSALSNGLGLYSTFGEEVQEPASGTPLESPQSNFTSPYHQSDAQSQFPVPLRPSWPAVNSLDSPGFRFPDSSTFHGQDPSSDHLPLGTGTNFSRESPSHHSIQKQTNGPFYSLDCPLSSCMRSFRTPNGLALHIKSHSWEPPNSYSRGISGTISPNRQTVGPPRKSLPSPSRSFPCPQPGCRRSFKARGGLTLHLKTHRLRSSQSPRSDSENHLF
ncbi:hypothetical protein BD410DRAFT_785012 [Rickenella mellea]|uniref:C2H2-type domain-containing protein n=1 Tax=Rickenella mellea TaxID=50990 RepID=A0A4Y7QDK9_9AGAM|nr:hypothetical protein BD410DRAFT_785012 [Rickenella mellea]